MPHWFETGTRFLYRSHIFRMDTVANVNDLLGRSESFGSLTIEREWKWTLPHLWGPHPSATSLHNVNAICFHSLAKCADVTTVAAYNRAVTLNKFPGEEPNDILSWQEITTTFLSLLCRVTVSSLLRMLLTVGLAECLYNTYIIYFSINKSSSYVVQSESLSIINNPIIIIWPIIIIEPFDSTSTNTVCLKNI